VRRKNISYLLVDVKRPTRNTVFTANTSKFRFKLSSVPENGEGTSSPRFVAIMFLIVLAFGGVAMWGVKEDAMGTAIKAYEHFLSAAESAKQYDTDGMSESLKKAETSLGDLDIYTRILGIIPAFKQVPAFASSLGGFNKIAISLTESVDNLKEDGMRLIWEDGQHLIAEVASARGKVNDMAKLFADIRNGMASFGLSSDNSDEYLSLHSKIMETETLLAGVEGLLIDGADIAVLFMNDSELRATGGFVGSYATVEITSGEIEDVSVNDIYYPDKFLEEKTVPPSPLMGTTVDWEARDANWFFDFPTSASKVIQFLEKSPVYADKNVKFEGAIAMNHKVVTDILKITGPIELPEYGIVLDDSNFLAEVQKEVSRDSTLRGGERKNVLKSLLPELIARIKNLSGSDKEELMRAIKARLENKDIQIYFTDNRIQSFIAKSYWGGEIYQMPESEYGDYLAVVVSNIAGEKTDAYVRQKVALKSVISNSGTIKNTLSIKRVHEGNKKTEAFYRAKNQTFIRALVPQGSELLETTGETRKTVKPAINYESKGYAKDADVELFESGTESGKTVFGEWLVISAGAEKELTMEYERIAQLKNKFRFVYEKQSGIDSMFSYSVEAPPGYIFEETGTSVYEYENSNLPVRLTIDLTLKEL
jgi:hypothetical protein